MNRRDQCAWQVDIRRRSNPGLRSTSDPASGIGLVVVGGNVIAPIISWVGLILLGIVWLSTASLQVPWHALLSKGWNERAARLLCSTNWIRTVGWSARAMLMTWAIWRVLALGKGMP